MHSLAQENIYEDCIFPLPVERIIAEGPWTVTQQRLLEVLQRREYRTESMRQICAAAGYSGNMAWYQAMKDPRFAVAVQVLAPRQWSKPQRRLLEVLQHPEHRNKSRTEICRLAGYKDMVAWYRAMSDEQFVAMLKLLGMEFPHRGPHRDHLFSGAGKTVIHNL